MSKILLPLLLLICGCATNMSAPERKIASDSRWGFLVMSDIHVYTSTRGGKKIVPKDFSVLVQQLLPYVDENNIKFIILLGDSTGGNQKDGHSLKTVKMWWNELRGALSPLMERGVKILPVAGNHDYYTKNHQEGYKYAWKSFVEPLEGELLIEAENPLYYTLTYGGLELFLLHAVTYDLGKEQEEWLKKELSKRRDNGNVKLAFGHYALYTRLIRRPFVKFGDKVRRILEAGSVKHYIAGHEHYYWDETIGSNGFRQTIMGTSSGTYNFAPHLSYFKRHCRKTICEMPTDGLKFKVRPNDRKQVHKQMFLHFKIGEENLTHSMVPMALEKGQIVPFGLP